MSAPVLCLPLAALLPLQPPDAVHEAALVELQLSVETPLRAMDVGFAASVTVGVPGTVTVTVAALLAPPAPEHFSE